jgi:hypothetical protein
MTKKRRLLSMAFAMGIFGDIRHAAGHTSDIDPVTLQYRPTWRGLPALSRISEKKASTICKLYC